MDLTSLATELLSTLGYVGMAVGLVLDSFGIPIPSEVLLTLGGTLAATGRFNVWAVYFIGVAAQIVGGLIGYGVGKYGGLPILNKYGKYVLISQKDLARTHSAFEKYGAVLTMVGRCIPLIRGLIAYPAGIAGMPLNKFIMYTAIGSSVWTAIFVWIGYTVGDNLSAINPYMHELTLGVIALAVIGFAWHVREPIIKIFNRKSVD